MYYYEKKDPFGRWGEQTSTDHPLSKKADGVAVELRNIHLVPEEYRDLPLMDLAHMFNTENPEISATKIEEEPEIVEEVLPSSWQSVYRSKILENASEIICGQRQEDYGPPLINFSNIAVLWTAYLEGRTDGRGIESSAEEHGTSAISLAPSDVAQMMVLLKIARGHSNSGEDTFIDEAGYAALAAELRREEDRA